MKKIKITHINPDDTQGGASLAGYRLHKELLKYPEVDSILYVARKSSNDKEVVQFSNFFLSQIERLLNKLGSITGLQYFFSIDWIPLLFKKRFRETDIFIIRMIHGGYLPFWFPWLLSKFAPVIWRLPDMWAFTGRCVYSYHCPKTDYPPVWIDLSSFLLKLKKFFYQRSKIFLVCPSRWLLEEARRSEVFKNAKKFYIPTGIDPDFFRPGVKNKKPTLVFVSSNLKDKRKGAEILPQILEKLNQVLKKRKDTLDLYLVGERDKEFPAFSNINYIFTGRLKEEDLPQYYASSHLSILPTLADNLPNTILESLACETPVVAFDIGGCKEAVFHLKTGYLARPLDIYDFVNGIVTLLSNPENLSKMGESGRKLVLEKFSQEIQVKEYLRLTKSILHI